MMVRKREGAPAKAPAKKAAGKGHPGGFIYHVEEMIRATREGKLAEAFGYALELLEMVRRDWDNRPAPLVFGTAGADLSVEEAAGRLEALVGEHKDALKGRRSKRLFAAEAFPWAELVPLVIALIQALLSRR